MGLHVGQSKEAWQWAQQDTGEKEKAKAVGGKGEQKRAREGGHQALGLCRGSKGSRKLPHAGKEIEGLQWSTWEWAMHGSQQQKKESNAAGEASLCCMQVRKPT